MCVKNLYKISAKYSKYPCERKESYLENVRVNKHHFFKVLSYKFQSSLPNFPLHLQVIYPMYFIFDNLFFAIYLSLVKFIAKDIHFQALPKMEKFE